MFYLFGTGRSKELHFFPENNSENIIRPRLYFNFTFSFVRVRARARARKSYSTPYFMFISVSVFSYLYLHYLCIYFFYLTLYMRYIFSVIERSSLAIIALYIITLCNHYNI